MITANLPLEGKGDREAVDEVYAPTLQLLPQSSAHPQHNTLSITGGNTHGYIPSR